MVKFLKVSMPGVHINVVQFHAAVDSICSWFDRLESLLLGSALLRGCEILMSRELHFVMTLTWQGVSCSLRR